MRNQQQNSLDLLLEANDSLEEVLLLEDEDIEYFQKVDKIINSQPVAIRQRTYLNALALVGFQEWIAERAAGIALDLSDCSLFQPALASTIDAVCNLRIGHLRICLITVEQLTEAVPFPRAAIALPEFIADFYGLIVVESSENEDSGAREVRVVIHSFLHYSQLMERDPLDTLQLQPDWNDLVPLEWFEESPAAFRVCLRSKTAPCIPQLNSQTHLIAITQHREDLEKIVSDYFSKPGLHFPALWEVLSWEQGCFVLTCPELRDWWYALSLSQTTIHPIASLRILLDQLTRQVFNTWYWFNHQLDDFAQYWQWSLQPPLLSALRNDQTPYQEAIAELRSKGIHLPTHESNACLDFEFAGWWLRLRAIPIPATGSGSSPIEWRLVVILEAQPHHTLPPGITLQVCDQTELLDEQCWDQLQDSYLYSSVVGGCEEQFFVTVRLANGLALTLPPFGYAANRV